MRVCFIARGLTKGGVYRFINSILGEIDKITEKECEFFLIHNEKKFRSFFKNIKEIYINTESRLLFDYILSFWIIRKLRFDVIIYSKNVIPLAHFFLKGKKINIIHDLGYFEKRIKAYPLLDTIFMKMFMKMSCKKSDKVFTVSDFSKRDLAERFNLKHSDIEVIHEGVGKEFKVISKKEKLRGTINKYGLKKPFLFYAGSISPRKNLTRILHTFNSLIDSLPHDLVITGIKEWRSKNIFSSLNEKTAKRIKVLGYVSDNDLVNLYNLADVYLYPSLHEGFGLPILEAQACGCPVLTSNITSCPEVAGAGAHIVDPYSEQEISEGIKKILEEDGYRDELVRKGFENIKRFSWKETIVHLLHSSMDSCIK